MHLPVPELDETLVQRSPENTQSDPRDLQRMREIVGRAQDRQRARHGCLNANLSGEALARRISEADLAPAFLADVCKKMELSMRSYHKIWRVALTIADLEHAEVPSAPDGHAEQPSPPTDLTQQHFIEALSYRTMTWSGEG